MEYPFKDLMPRDEATARDGYYKDWMHIDADTFHQISELAKFIREKGRGADTREAIAQALERVYHDAAISGNANMEVSQARGSYPTLAERLMNLDKVDRDNLNELTVLLADKIKKGNVTMADLTQEVKEALTGGSVAVVGKDAVGEINVLNHAITPQKTNFFENKVKINVEGILVNKGFGTKLVDGVNRFTALTQYANHRTLIVPVTEGEKLYLERGDNAWESKIAFASGYPHTIPFPVFEGKVARISSFPSEITVPTGAKYMLWNISNTSTVPTFGLYREKIKSGYLHDPDIYEWSENIFKNQYVVGKVVSDIGGYLNLNNAISVILPVKENEVYRINKNSGNLNTLGFFSSTPTFEMKPLAPVTVPILPAEITVPKGAKYLVWSVRDDNIVPAIDIRKKILKSSILKDKQFPEMSSVITSFGGIIEHEWRSTKNNVYTSPKVFVIDGYNAIYSTTDYGQSYKFETQLDYKAVRQYSNCGHRMLFEASSLNSRTGTVRIYTDDYELVSERTDVWLPYNENGADGKPNVDGTWVFAEYVSAPAGGNLGLGVRVMLTRDNGVTWEEKLKIMDVDHIHSCRYDPYNPNHIYINTGDANVEMRNRWYASYDDGETWELLAGGTKDEGKTPLVDGTFAHDKWMRTTAIAMGVDTGTKGRNSIFYFHDNSPTGFVRYDKKLKKFQIIFDNLKGVAYGTTITEDGMYTIVQTAGEHDVLHYILFPVNDDDIDNPSAYQLFTVKLPKKGYKAMLRSSRTIDLAGNSVIGTNINYYENVGQNLVNNQNGKSLGIKVNFGWVNDSSGNLNLMVQTKPIMPVY